MPPKKPPIGKTQNKSDISDKVKEIKLRQQNWLKQREEHHSNTSLPSKPEKNIDTKYSKSKQQANNNNSLPGLYNESSVQKQNTVQKQSLHGKSKGFNAWMKARDKPGDNESNSTDRSALGASYVISKEKTYSVRKEESKETEFEASPTHSSHLDNPQHTRLHQSVPESHLAGDKFDALADQIVNRVRNELELKNKPYYANQYQDKSIHNEPHQSSHQYKQNENSPETSHSSFFDKPGSSLSSTSDRGSNYLEGHYCPQCAQLMIGKHDPMLVIPCGHNICKACSEIEDLDLCTVCSCEVSSFTSNIMLKQIIVDHKRDKRRMENTRSKRESRQTADTQVDERDYKEEIKTLMLRLDVLETESDNIKETMDSIKREIKVEHKQIANIEKQEERIREEIDELNTKLDALSNHKQDYYDKSEKLEEKHRIQEDKLTMVKDTIHQLNRDVENIQLSANI